MNDNACDDSINRPVFLKNEVTPDDVVCDGAALAPIAAAGAAVAGAGNRTTMMRILKKGRISIESETRIFRRGNGP